MKVLVNRTYTHVGQQSGDGLRQWGVLGRGEQRGKK